MKKPFQYIVLLAFAFLLQNCKQQQPDWTHIVTFTDSSTRSIAADGYDTVPLTAHIPTDSDPDKRAVTFSTDFGTFTNGQNTITLNADASGNAVTAIKSTASGIATVRATVAGSYPAIKTINFTPPGADDFFTIDPVANNIPADGVTTTLLSATVNKALLTSSQSVVFAADGGSFGNNTQTTTIIADPSGLVQAYLKSSVAGIIHVSITNNGMTQNIPVTFVPAVPDYLLLSASTSLQSGYANTLSIVITGKRNIGVPGPGFMFAYSAVDSSGNNIGIFSNGGVTDSNGAASVNYTTGGSVYKGPVTITVSLQQYPTIKTSIIVQII